MMMFAHSSIPTTPEKAHPKKGHHQKANTFNERSKSLTSHEENGFHRQATQTSQTVQSTQTTGAKALTLLDDHEALWKQCTLEHLLKECVLNESLAAKLQQKLHASQAESQEAEQEAILKQIEELCQVYSFQQALQVFGIRHDENHMLYDSLAETLSTMMGSTSCTLLHQVMHSYEAHMFQLVGHSSLGLKSREEKAFSVAFEPENAATSPVIMLASELPIHHKETQWALYQGEPVALVGHRLPEVISGLEIVQHPARHWLLVPVKCYQKGHLSALLMFEAPDTYVFRKEQIAFGKACGALYQLAQALQQLVKETQQTIHAYHQKTLPESHHGMLLSTRTRLTELVSEFTLEQQSFAEALAAWVDARERHTQGYSQEVARLALGFGKHLHLNEKTLELLYFAGLLGNVGRFSIPTELLRKKDTLSQEDWQTIEQHPNVGVHLLMQMSFLTDIVPFVHHQRERWDGKGYPDQLHAWDIPLGSRILGLASAFVALLQPRGYRQKTTLQTHTELSSGYSVAEALAVLRTESGTKWDPALVELLAHMVQ
jgi:HD-GYP domain-containing protein (c-di-GMP phosphodiesterase class II)